MFEGTGRVIQGLFVAVVALIVLGVAGVASMYWYKGHQVSQAKQQQAETANTLGQVYKARLIMKEQKLLVSEINVWPRNVLGDADPSFPQEVLLFKIPDDPQVTAKNRSFAVAGQGTATRVLWFTEAENTVRPVRCRAEFCK